MIHPLPAQSLLNELFEYDPDTGIVIRKVKTNLSAAGCIVGCICERPTVTYLVVRIKQIKYVLHRIIWKMVTGEDPNFIDHINGIGTDNRWVNLRNVDRVANQRNCKVRQDNKSGTVGVGKHKLSGKWAANIRHNKRQIHLGLFDTLEEAVKVRKSAEIKFNYHPNHGKRL